MDQQPDETVEVLRAVWAADGRGVDDLPDDCGPQKACKNMQHVSFDGLAEPGTDLHDAWKDLLSREGKRQEGSAGTIRDLVLGHTERT